MARSPQTLVRRVGKPVVFLLALVPALLLVHALLFDLGRLGADPVETLQAETGEWALIFLAITLAVTPLRRLFGWNWLQPFRRMLGLFAFFYASLHLANYLILWMELDVADITEDVIEHPWVWIGVAAWLTLVPLAITSTKGWVRRLGGRRWQRLHRLTYVAALLGLVHFWLAVKQDKLEPAIYAAIIVTLLLARPLLRRGSAPRATRRAAAEDLTLAADERG